MSKIAIFIDLENCGVKPEILENLMTYVKIRGNILVSKAYGYTEKYEPINHILLENSFTVLPSIRHGGSNKNNADIQLALDALEIAYTNTLIDEFIIVSGDSDYIPLVSKLKSMNKFVIGISRSAAANNTFIKVCDLFKNLENFYVVKSSTNTNTNKPNSLTSEKEANNEIVKILESNTEEEIFAGELKNIILRLFSDFSEKNYGYSSFVKFLEHIQTKYGQICVIKKNDNYYISLNTNKNNDKIKIDESNWINIFKNNLKTYKSSGFTVINPSILKADILKEYPDFDEKNFGYKRFSDLMYKLQENNLVKVESNPQGTMLINIS